MARVSRLEVLGAAVLFSTGGAAIKSTDLPGVSGGLEVAGWRSAVAAAAMALVLPAARRGWTWRTWAVGTAYAATVILFVLANKETTSANAIFLQSTAPLYVLLFGTLLLGERTTLADVGLMGVMLVGLAMFVVSPGEAVATAPDPRLGNVLALASGVTWAATLLGLRWLARSEVEGSRAALGSAVCGNAIAAVVCLPFAMPPSAHGQDWLLILYLGLFQIGLAYVLLTSAVRYVNAFDVSLLLILEPALNPVWAWLVHGEEPGALAILGGVLILGATLAKTLLDRRRAPPGAAADPAAAR
jgi:drug/metabolite transporter (DMT)-like permease